MAEFAAIFTSICALNKFFSVEVRQLVNGVDDVVNATLEASEDFTSQ